MKSFLCPLLALLAISAAAQTPAQTKSTWGDEFKMSNGSTDLSIIAADNTGEYLEESHEIRRMYQMPRKSAELVKLTPNLTEVYRNDFDKELKGKAFERFFFLKDKLFLFASEFSRKDEATLLFVSEVDKATGKLTGDWRQVYKWQKADKHETLKFRIAPSDDSTRVILTATYEGKSTNRYELQILDDNLSARGDAMVISNEFDPKTFQVEDFVFTPCGNAVVVGRLYEYEEGRRKSNKNLDFKNYNIRIYSPDGKLVKELITDANNKFLVTSKLMSFKKEVILAAFYSNEKRKKTINGMLVERINPATGEIVTSTDKELNASSITQVDDAEADKDYLKRRGDNEDGLTANMRFNKFYLTPDGGVIVLAEGYQSYLSYSTSPSGYTTTTTTYMNFDCGDIYMSKVNAQGSIDWIHVVPKSQYESILIGESMGYAFGFTYGSYYFDNTWSYPFYAGFGSIPGQTTLRLFFNDYPVNGDVLEPGKKIRKVHAYGGTSVYEIDLDMITGKYTRKELFSNKDIPNAMPRLGVTIGNTLYLTGRELKFMGRPRVAVGRLVTPG